MASTHFTTNRNDNPSNFSYCPATSYLRDNIVAPTVTLARASTVLDTEADTALEDRLPSGATVTSEPTVLGTAA